MRRPAHERVRQLPLWIAAFLAAAGGYALSLAYPGTSIWWLALVGVALICVAMWNQKARHGVWIGMLAGSTFWLPLISWLSLYLGPIPWIALASVMIAWHGLFGALIAATTRASSRLAWPPVLLALTQATIVAGLWVTREQLQSSWPYGGFPWGRLAHSQADGPFIALVSWVGFAGLSGVLACLATLPVAGLMLSRGGFRRTVPVAIAVICGVLLTSVPPALLPVHGQRTVAGIQGNSKSGVFDDRESGDVIADHINVTKEWLRTNPDPVDAVVWPENSGEFQLATTPRNLDRIRALVQEAQAPFSVGTILAERTDSGDLYTNSSIVIEPGSAALGRYDKRYPVPFAEYMPHREFYRALVPHLVDLVVLDYQAGTTPSVLTVGDMRAGHAICFDIIFDALAVDMVGSGAEVIFAPTNNADFGFTDQSEQQLAIARLRAVETGRDLVHVSTVATSAIISRTGDIVERIPQWEPGVMTGQVDLVSGATPAIRFGAQIAACWMVLGLGGATLMLLLAKRGFSRKPSQALR